jgi:UDP-N-acetylmuramate dehydrogenase
MTFTNIRGEVREREPLAGYTSFRIGGPADLLVTPADRKDLIALLLQVRQQKLPFVILGGGTNLLVRDGGVRGVVISLKRIAAVTTVREYRSLGGTFAVVLAEAGGPLAGLMRHTVDRGWSGLEFAAGIPGTVGGAVCMNAGTSQGWIGDVIDTVTLLSPKGELIIRHQDELSFGYREHPAGQCGRRRQAHPAARRAGADPGPGEGADGPAQGAAALGSSQRRVGL